MSWIPTINAETEAAFTRKYNLNRPSIGIVIRPGKKINTIRLFVVGRPPSPHGKAQGDHTLAWGATSRCLEWMLEDVTLEEAVVKIDQLHSGFSVAFLSSFTTCHELMERAVSMHKYITSGKCPKDLLCSWITEYLMTYTYIRNSLPEASILLARNSGTLGERDALKTLKDLENGLKSAGDLPPQTRIVEALSTLIDKRAVKASLQKSANTSSFYALNGTSERSVQQILAFQIIGINDLLQSLPNVAKLFLSEVKGSNLLLSGHAQVPDSLLADLAAIILYSPDQKPSDATLRAYKSYIRDALSMITRLALADVNSLYGVVH